MSAMSRRGGSPEGERKSEDQFGILDLERSNGQRTQILPKFRKLTRGGEFKAERAAEKVRESIEDRGQEHRPCCGGGCKAVIVAGE